MEDTVEQEGWLPKSYNRASIDLPCLKIQENLSFIVILAKGPGTYLGEMRSHNEVFWKLKSSITAYKTPIGASLYKLVYRKACHLPIELAYKAFWAIKALNIDLKLSGEKWILKIEELEEFRLHSYENSKIYKERTKMLHNKRIKEKALHKGDKVLLFNSRYRLFSGKLNSQWTGPFVITNVRNYGDFEIMSEDGNRFKVNGQRIKPYYEGAFVGEVEAIRLKLLPP
ncbi:uncharacterized protein LOC141627759 [Silene latifolia]|uniref:uncharacterized protein LOC141627759 n=1 Tax=Silene latifolia TaxID=37657 RepID=UPI003D7809BC